MKEADDPSREGGGEDPRHRDSTAAGEPANRAKVPIENWVPHPVSDSSEYLKRRAPWRKWVPPGEA
jgi:hypothetical protein